MKRWLAIPVRLALGLHPFWGLTVKSRALHLARKVGLYSAPIDFVFNAPPFRVGLDGKGIG